MEVSDWRHRRLKPPEGYPHEDWAAGVYLKEADEYITELEAELASLREAVLELGDCSCPTILYTEKMRCAVCQLKRKAQEGE